MTKLQASQIRSLQRAAMAVFGQGAILLTLVLSVAVSGCGGGGGGGHNGAGAAGSAGTPTGAAGSVVSGVVPAQSRAALTVLSGSSGGLGYNDGAGDTALFDQPSGIAVDAAGNRYVADTQNDVIRKIDPQDVVSLFAGQAGVPGDSDGSASSAKFSGLSGIAIDASGTLYVTQSNGAVRSVDASGNVVTLSFPIDQSRPSGPSVDGSENIYFADALRAAILVLRSDRSLSLIAGGSGNTAYQDGSAQSATFLDPVGVAEDAAGNLYVADAGDDVIRKITAGGVVSTLAGMPRTPGTVDGTGNAASFIQLHSISFDGSELLVTDGSTLRSVSLGGSVVTIHDFGQAQLATPDAAVRDASGQIDVTLGVQIVQVTDAGIVTALAGEELAFGNVDAAGSAARFNNAINTATPAAIASDQAGNIYVADTGNGTIRKISAAGVVSTLAGSTTANADGSPMLGYTDGTGSAARFSGPTGIAVSAAGMVYVSDSQVVRQITPAGVVTTLAGTPTGSGAVQTDGQGVAARFTNPGAMVIDRAGNVFLADNPNPAHGGFAGGPTVRRVAPDGTVVTIAGKVSQATILDGTGDTAAFGYIRGLALDHNGNIFVADYDGDIGALRVINTDSQVRTLQPTLASNSADPHFTNEFDGPLGVAIDASGQIYLSTFGCTILRFLNNADAVPVYAGISNQCGSRVGALPGALYLPTALTVAGNGLAITTPGAVFQIR